MRCFQISHHQEVPCGGDTICPLREVTTKKATTTVVHTHRAADGQERFLEIIAAPIFDSTGSVTQIVETCRDITERTQTRRFLEIANRHAEMAPLLQEFVAEVRQFTCCAAVGIRILDDQGTIPYECAHGFSPEFCQSESRLSEKNECCLCLGVVNGTLNLGPAVCTPGGTFYCASLTQFLAAAPTELTGAPRNLCRTFGYESVALVPIRVGTQILGLIHLADPRANVVSQEMVDSAERAAMQLGTAIQRVRAEEALRQTLDELEAKVQARTAQLAEANRALKDEIRQRNRLEREILRISAEEQQRIGQELHDGLGQELTGLGYLAKSHRRHLLDQGNPEAETAGELARGIPQALSQVRSIVKGLLPLGIGAQNIASALETLVVGMEERTGVSCRLECAGPPPIRDDDTAIQIYRIAQEALTNALKHGRPQSVVLVLGEEHNGVVLEIRDDGTGIPADAEKAGGAGLRIMRHRTRVIGGVLEIERGHGEGTVVRCLIPKE
jgi:signal transduction histidine kinase